MPETNSLRKYAQSEAAHASLLNQICQIEFVMQSQIPMAEPYMWTHHKV